jgi:hypothetical protein
MLIPLAHDSPMRFEGPMKYLEAVSPGVTIHTVLSTGRITSSPIPGNKLPGYDHQIPTG